MNDSPMSEDFWPIGFGMALRDRTDLSTAIRDSIAMRAKMSPVDRALEYADQRQSFVRGMVSHHPDFSDDPLVVLANEVRRLRASRASD
jgi:hypothetical protein